MVTEEDGPPVPELARRIEPDLLRPRPRSGLRPGARAHGGQRRRARRRPGRLGLCPPATPSTGPCRCAPLGAQLVRTSTPMTAGPRAPTRRHHLQRQPATARPRRGRCWSSARSPATPPPTRPPPTTADRRDSPATSSAASPPTTPTATTGSCARPSWASSAARCGRRQCPSTDHGPRSSPRPSTRRACCAQQTITVAPEVHAKTAQKHDYPSKAHRDSYARRTAAERTFSTAKDPASNDIAAAGAG